MTTPNIAQRALNDQIPNLFDRNRANKSGEIIPEGYNQYKLSQYTPEQTKLFGSQFKHVGDDSFLSKLAMGDQSAFEEMEEPAMRKFSAMQGNLASRFSGMGTGGRHSSGFQNTMTQAGQDFASELASKRLETRMKALEELMGFSDRILGQRPYEQGLQQEAPGFMENFAGGLGGAIPGAVIGGLTGGPPGAIAGGAAGFAGGYQRKSGGTNRSMI